MKKKKESTFLLVSLDDSKAKKLANVISSDTSRKILDALAAGPHTETEIAKKLSVPLSTVHYNLRLLLEGGLVESGEFHYSSKGREVAHYTLANKYIIIAPKNDEKLLSRLRGFLPALIVSLGAGIAAWYWNVSRTAQPEMMVYAPIAAKTAGSELADEFAMQQTAIAPAEPNVALWYFAGVATVLTVWLVAECYFYFRRK